VGMYMNTIHLKLVVRDLNILLFTQLKHQLTNLRLLKRSRRSRKGIHVGCHPRLQKKKNHDHSTPTLGPSRSQRDLQALGLKGPGRNRTPTNFTPRLFSPHRGQGRSRGSMGYLTLQALRMFSCETQINISLIS